jgi:hypothetical protein
MAALQAAHPEAVLLECQELCDAALTLQGVDDLDTNAALSELGEIEDALNDENEDEQASVED